MSIKKRHKIHQNVVEEAFRGAKKKINQLLSLDDLLRNSLLVQWLELVLTAEGVYITSILLLLLLHCRYQGEKRGGGQATFTMFPEVKCCNRENNSDSERDCNYYYTSPGDY